MIEFYPQIKWVHVATVLASGLVFALRGLLVQAGRQRWAMAAPVRHLSYAIDTTLLTAALMLLTILPGAMFANGWLTAKLVLLVVYVGLGTFALRRGRTARVRTACYLAALTVFGFMYTIARTHHPGGMFWLLTAA
ncbi:SirB2 family protein [Luteimonas terricola]|uniref:SirB family protein n=1 Tax=Luteimonas terricola TaxID=645597 RepID=A0ABQ2EBU2_9GAMM|nr:SirB2 family protein [Luteimonas terricola]GGK05793.1 SirB family protein [Luteimonas terricola]